MASFGYIQLARVCNQDCVFCSAASNGRFMALAQAKKLIAAFQRDGYDGVILTGGEPTLHPDLEEVISSAAGRGFYCRMITNGQKTSDKRFLARLARAGLKHINVSLHSHRDKVQAKLTRNQDSLRNIRKTLDTAGGLGMITHVNIVLNRLNADHLSDIARWLVGRYPFVGHFVWNNLDPQMSRKEDAAKSAPRLRDLELELFRALSFLESAGKTFRVERVPLCFMPEFAWAATETRAMLRHEERGTYFLDGRGLIRRRGFARYSKPERCGACSLTGICAGLYMMDKYYSSDELSPVFVSQEAIRRRVLGEGVTMPLSSLGLRPGGLPFGQAAGSARPAGARSFMKA